jgi:small GTP-binding protein
MQPTVGVDFVSKTVNVEGKSLRMQLWDTAGQERFHSLIPSYIKDSTAALIVFDLTSIRSAT